MLEASTEQVRRGCRERDRGVGSGIVMRGPYYIVKALHSVANTDAVPGQALERLWALALLLGEGMQIGLAERGLTMARAHLLWQLNESGPSTQRSLSRALRVTPRNITGLIDALQADGFVARAAHPSDRRATLVTLTEKGTAATAAMRRDQDQFAQALFDDASAADLATFVKILDRILARIREALPPAR